MNPNDAPRVHGHHARPRDGHARIRLALREFTKLAFNTIATHRRFYDKHWHRITACCIAAATPKDMAMGAAGVPGIDCFAAYPCARRTGDEHIT